MKHLLLAAAIALAPAAIDAEAAIDKGSPCMPYTGESMSFDVGWEFINAGSATMNIAPMESGWQIKTFARTNKMLDVFRKVRDTITAEGLCVDGHMQSTLFDANLMERKYSAKKRVEFLWQQGKATHTQDHKTEDFDVPAGHLSVLDAFLAVRNLKLTPGEVVKVPVFDSRKRYEIEVHVSAEKAKLMAPWGKTVECLVIRPKLLSEGIFTNKGEMIVWLTDDDRHIPIRMSAKIKFGHIIASLTGYSNNSHPPTATSQR